MKTKPENVDSYLSSIPAGQRASLSALRDQINRFRPEATEHIAYSEPLFKLNGHPLVAFRASKNHCGFFVWSGTALGTLGSLLDGFDTAMATIRFAPGTTLPDHVVKAVIDARAKEIEDRWGTLPPRRPADSAP